MEGGTQDAIKPDSVASGAESPSRFLQALVEESVLSEVFAERVARVHAETSDGLPLVLLKLGLLSEEDLANRMARFADCLRLSAADVPAGAIEIAGINPAFLRSRGVVPLGTSAEQLRLACWDATDTYAPRALEFATGLRVVRLVGTRTEVEKVADQLYPARASDAAPELPADELDEREELDRLKDLASDAPIIRLVQRHLVNPDPPRRHSFQDRCGA